MPEFSLGKYPFVDHNICSMRQLFNICMDMFLFIQGVIRQKNDIINTLAGHFHGNNFSQQ